MKGMKTELELIRIAECGGDEEATAAMIELRERFDPTYIWCADCDYIVVKFNDCCWERVDCDDSTKVSF